ncbi:MAG TPA: hypothetical protein VHG08_19025 [Longimicrobium sp.]|nr:hypothetical protein [Longimicrobium sp.]
MKKLAMKLDELRVETFTTDEQPVERGTVHGHYGTTHTQATNCDYTCPGFRTYGDRYVCVRC